jgi:hypothetical protein
MKVRVLAAVAALALGTAFSGGAAQAATYFLNSDPNNTFTGPDYFGTVTVTAIAGGLQFDVKTAGTYTLDTTGGHVMFAGNVSGTLDSTTPFTSPDSANVTFASSTTPSISNSPFTNGNKGAFDFGVDCNTGSGAWCGMNGGGGHPFGQELIFDLFGVNLAVQPASGYPNIYFSADVADTSGTFGNTGVVGATAGGVPEPATWGLLISGVFCIGAAMRMQRAKVLTAA